MRCLIASLLTVLLTTPRPAAAQSATDSVSPSASSAPAAPCLDNGLHLLVARGTGEPATPGLGSVLSQLSRNITSRVGANATVEAVVYPAEGAAGLAAAVTAAAADSKGVASLQALQGSADALAYAASEREGVRAVSGQLATYLGRCPRGRVALLGFEQGAQAMADALCGTAGPTPQLLGFSQPGIAPDLAKNVVAIVLLQNPAQAANLTWDFGNATRDGVLARDNDISCVPFVTSMRSYCDVGDAYCDGPRGTTIPGAYLSRYGGDITDFVVSQWNASVVAANVSQTPNANGAPLDVGRGRAAFAAAAATIAGLMLAAAPGLG